MKLFIITTWNPDALSPKIVKVFSTQENLDRWMECAKLMRRELTGDPNLSLSAEQYKVHEAELDNLDFVQLLAESRGLGATLKPSQP